MTKTKREWKDIPGFEGKYCFNGLNVKSVSRKKSNRKCSYFTKEILLKEKTYGNGYIYYGLTIKKPKSKGFLKHRLVWWYFNGKIPKNLQINHKNGIKNDNRIENLELVTPKQNCWHKDNVLGKCNKGSRHGLSKLTEDKVVKIKKLLKGKDFGLEEIAEMFDVSRTSIFNIKHNTSWRHVSGTSRRS